MELREWLEQTAATQCMVYLKRLSANDTGASGGHQVGIYIPKAVMEMLFPELSRTDVLNPDAILTAKTMSHLFADQSVRAIYYNNCYFDGTRNEKRITRWGGAGSPLQNPENTGALTLLSFSSSSGDKYDQIQVWVCRDAVEEGIVESMIGEVIPGDSLFGPSSQLLMGFVKPETDKTVDYRIPEKWKTTFPTGEELIGHLPEVFKFSSCEPDKLLLERREVEYSLFKKVEEHHILDRVKEGFNSIDEFIGLANSVSNRRKSRSGKSLELHLESIFRENGLTCFSTQAVTEGNKKPDFLFPSAEAYHDENWCSDKLRMLAVKTTCKDRWRQILNEADRISPIHLFTLQEGVSINQFDEMRKENVILVVPAPLHKKFPKDIRADLLSLSDFIEDTKAVCGETHVETQG